MRQNFLAWEFDIKQHFHMILQINFSYLEFAYSFIYHGY